MRGAMVKYRNEKPVNQVRPDPALALIWFGRLAEAGDGQAQALLADRMQTERASRPRSLKPPSGTGGSLRRPGMPKRRSPLRTACGAASCW